MQFMFFVHESDGYNGNQNLRYIMIATTHGSYFSVVDFCVKDFNYSITNLRLWKNLDILLYPVIIMGGALLFSLKTSYMVIVLASLFCLGYAIFMYSTFRRLRSYYNDNKDISLRFSRGDDFIH